jgi:hypothetical protein
LYSSHGAYVTVGDLRGYVPLRLMGNPPPRSAREVMKHGEAITLVVDSFSPPRRNVDLALPGVVTAVPAIAASDAAPPAPTKRTRTKKAAEPKAAAPRKTAERTVAQKKAAPKKVAAKKPAEPKKAAETTKGVARKAVATAPTASKQVAKKPSRKASPAKAAKAAGPTNATKMTDMVETPTKVTRHRRTKKAVTSSS